MRSRWHKNKNRLKENPFPQIKIVLHHLYWDCKNHSKYALNLMPPTTIIIFDNWKLLFKFKKKMFTKPSILKGIVLIHFNVYLIMINKLFITRNKKYVHVCISNF